MLHYIFLHLPWPRAYMVVIVRVARTLDMIGEKVLAKQ